MKDRTPSESVYKTPTSLLPEVPFSCNRKAEPSRAASDVGSIGTDSSAIHGREIILYVGQV